MGARGICFVHSAVPARAQGSVFGVQETKGIAYKLPGSALLTYIGLEIL
jgi:hypothetical protein